VGGRRAFVSYSVERTNIYIERKKTKEEEEKDRCVYQEKEEKHPRGRNNCIGYQISICSTRWEASLPELPELS